MIERANETIDKLNENIKNNEERILELNKYIKLAKANYDVETLVNLEDIKREYKALNRRLRQSKKSLMKIIAESTEMEETTLNAVSNKPLAREFLWANYRVTNSFKDVSLNTINDELPSRLSSHALSKLVREVFPEVQERKCTNDIKYNMEMII